MECNRYHAHAMATIQDGLYGPIYIRYFRSNDEINRQLED